MSATENDKKQEIRRRVMRRDIAVDKDGAVIVNAGKYARECVLATFEMIGGVEAMAAWAMDNPEEFYTKLFSKTITRDVETTDTRGVEDYIKQIEGNTIDVTPVREEEQDDDIDPEEYL